MWNAYNTNMTDAGSAQYMDKWMEKTVLAVIQLHWPFD